MSSCPLCGYGISTFAISLDAEFVMCGNENCTYPFEEDVKVIRAAVTDKRSPEAIAVARKRKAQSLVSPDTNTTAKKSKMDCQRKPAPPTAISGPSSCSFKPLAKLTSAASAKSPSTLTAVPQIPIRAHLTAAKVPATPSDQPTLPDLRSVDASLAPMVGQSAIPASGQTNATTSNNFLSSIPDFENVVDPTATSPTILSTALGTSSTRASAKPAKLSTSSTANFATPASTPLSSPTELLSASDFFSADAATVTTVELTSTPAATPPDTTSHSDAHSLSDFLSSIPDFDTTTTANFSPKSSSNLDDFHSLSLDFLDAEPWTPPVTPPNQPLPIDTLSSKQNLDMSAANLESLLFDNDFEIAFDQEFSAELQAVLQG
ncbi:hypothetical protein EC957_006663 [Mortierella hygrophila]|uniref:Uncharacterized protein n=1 Tax=Mortierella hygrophila TaxID=979708 RepID=A0A9P6K6E4_9FUNG|nr:hypothetical protein EC957_006663 [Mortierella hygrophila]